MSLHCVFLAAYQGFFFWEGEQGKESWAACSGERSAALPAAWRDWEVDRLTRFRNNLRERPSPPPPPPHTHTHTCRVIEPTEVGLHYNPNTRKLNRQTIHGAGRHIVLPGCYFFKFPTSLISFEFYDDKMLSCWTKDKQVLTLEMLVQLRIKSHEKGKVGECFPALNSSSSLHGRGGG